MSLHTAITSPIGEVLRPGKSEDEAMFSVLTLEILWFGDIKTDGSQKRRVGGKNQSCAEMIQGGLDVPNGFAIPVELFREHLRANKLEVQIRTLLRRYQQGTIILSKACATIRELVERAPMPSHVRDLILANVRLLKDVFLAIRSSGIAEDGAKLSFAGMNASKMYVKGDENVVKAVIECWASRFTDRSVSYSLANKIDPLIDGISIAVMEMVFSEAALVGFSLDTQTSDRNILTFELVLGHGHGLVAGEITPDLILVNRETGEVIQWDKVEQEKMLVHVSQAVGPTTPSEEEGLVWTDVPEELRKRQKITNETLQEAVRQLILAEEMTGNVAMDVEYAVAGLNTPNPRVAVVQKRPYTASNKAVADNGPAEIARILISGRPAGPGVGYGRVIIAKTPAEAIRKGFKAGDGLVTEMTDPDWEPLMAQACFVITEKGGRTCHAAIICREKRIACIVGIKGLIVFFTDMLEKLTAEHHKSDIMVTVDGHKGHIFEGEAKQRLAYQDIWMAAQYEFERAKTRMKLYTILSQIKEVAWAAKMNVDGCGLLRVEHIISQINTHPRSYYNRGQGHIWTRKVKGGIKVFVDGFGIDRPVIIRLEDLKTNEYRRLRGGKKYEEVERNPMIGYRGAVRYIKEPELFRLTLRAIKELIDEQVGEYGRTNIVVMVPFVRTPDQMRLVKKLMAEEGLVREVEGGIPGFKIWMMAELPTNFISADLFLEVGVDGFSVGSNDLTQLTLGIDRDDGSEELSADFDERDESIIRQLWMLSKAVQKWNKRFRRNPNKQVTLGFCGNAPSTHFDYVELLVRMGFTSVSVFPDAAKDANNNIARTESMLAAS